ncbi:Protein of unknown function [Blastococcus aggregatus]|uniref:Uncharacterized protein n=1 Tax=Blastococcus aggregatus TaxID=38502 RepID=A0A285V0X5_9ACTN|nr:DinB family protein [Blastococcus aggregatus]SOC46181.1 Protein of unknown function [Blastococcus aggregatus]
MAPVPELAHPDLQPEDERTALLQRLDQYRAIAAAALVDVPWEQASQRLLPATDMTIAGIVRHLAWVEDRWFQGRLLGNKMPSPWDAAGADDPDRSMHLTPGDTSAGIAALYASACERSRSAVDRCDSLGQIAVVPSFGRGPVNLRWILVHMIDETARHAGHLDLLRDCLTPHDAPDRPEIVCICGSARFVDELSTANRDLTFAGAIVLAPGVFVRTKDQEANGLLTDQQMSTLGALHLRKIDLADRVLVVNPGGYIGESTRREITYAHATGKPVSFTDPG